MTCLLKANWQDVCWALGASCLNESRGGQQTSLVSESSSSVARLALVSLQSCVPLRRHSMNVAFVASFFKRGRSDRSHAKLLSPSH